jgi:hypothetical protein
LGIVAAFWHWGSIRQALSAWHVFRKGKGNGERFNTPRERRSYQLKVDS